MAPVDLNLTVEVKTALFLFALLGWQHTKAKISHPEILCSSLFNYRLFHVVEELMTGLRYRNTEILQDLT